MNIPCSLCDLDQKSSRANTQYTHATYVRPHQGKDGSARTGRVSGNDGQRMGSLNIGGDRTVRKRAPLVALDQGTEDAFLETFFNPHDTFAMHMVRGLRLDSQKCLRICSPREICEDSVLTQCTAIAFWFDSTCGPLLSFRPSLRLYYSSPGTQRLLVPFITNISGGLECDVFLVCVGCRSDGSGPHFAAIRLTTPVRADHAVT